MSHNAMSQTQRSVLDFDVQALTRDRGQLCCPGASVVGGRGLVVTGVRWLGNQVAENLSDEARRVARGE